MIGGSSSAERKGDEAKEIVSHRESSRYPGRGTYQKQDDRLSRMNQSKEHNNCVTHDVSEFIVLFCVNICWSSS